MFCRPASKRKTRTRETSFPVSSNSPMSTGRTAGLWPEVVRDAGPLTGGAAVGSDESFQIAIDRIVHDDMEGDSLKVVCGGGLWRRGC